MSDYYDYAACVGCGAILASIVTGSFMPIIVVGIGLFLLYNFFTGLCEGKGSGRMRRN